MMVSKRQRATLFSYLVLVVLLVHLLLLQRVDSTEVKWTAGQVDKDNAAATAPRSQKYWDEHNIERPDYAKTDQELAAEKSGTSPETSWWRLVLIAMGLFLFVGYQTVWNTEGSRLGGGRLRSSFRHANAEEEARQARLAKFEHVSSLTGKQE